MASPVAQIERVLVATDFSAGARAALDVALGIASRETGEIHLVHAIPSSALQYLASETSEDAAAQARQLAESKMQRLIKEIGPEARRVKPEIVQGGSVWSLLEEFVQRHRIELLVLGTHGQTGGKKQLLGPVAEAIFRLATCPVLTVALPDSPAAAVPATPQRVLYATNFKPHAERASAYAYGIERNLHAQLTVLHVVEDQHGALNDASEIVREFMINRMRRGMPAACVGKCEPAFEVRFGDAGDEILEAARAQKADLIILGVRTGSDAAGLLPSAVAYKIACQAPCPVLTTRL